MAEFGNPLSAAFWAGAPANSPLSYEALQTRRKIAEQLMGKRSPFPKTFGEGLTYAGERFADVMDMNRLDAAEKQQAAYEANVLRGGPPLPGSENAAVAPAAPPVARPTASVPAGNLPVGNSAPLEAGTPGAPLERASPEEGGYNFLDAQALAGGRGPRFRTERNAEVGSRVGFDKAIQGINPEMQARMLAAYEAMPDNIKQTFAYNEGSRPRDYQQYLYDTRSGRGPVAPPGTSRHEAGQAIDVDRGAALDWLKQNGAQFGLESIRGDYPHLQMARSGAAFGNPNSPATLPIPGQSAVPPMPPGSRDAMASAIVNPSPPGSMVNTPAPLSGGTATPDMLSPGGFTQPNSPIRTAALTGGMTRGAGPQVAALPPQTPLDPANNPAIPSPIPLAPAEVRAPGVQTAQAPALRPSQEPIPPASLPDIPALQEVPTRPMPLGPRAEEKHWQVVMNNPQISDRGRAYAAQQLSAWQEHRKELDKQQQEDFTHKRGTAEAANLLRDKIIRDLPKEQQEELVRRLNIEKVQATNPFEARQAEANLNNTLVTIEKSRQEIAAGKAPEVMSIGDQRYQWDQASRTYKDITPGVDPSNIKLSETQAKTLKFFERATFANQQLRKSDDVLARFMDTRLGSAPLIGNYLTSPEYQKLDSAREAWGQAVLRDESGAVLSIPEIKRKLSTYFAVPGDKPETIRDKALRRAYEEKSLLDSLGNARPVAERYLTDREVRKVTDPKIPEGEVQTSDKGRKRVNIGGYWEVLP